MNYMKTENLQWVERCGLVNAVQKLKEIRFSFPGANPEGE